MPRIAQKTHKGLKKRVKVTATGKILYKKPGMGHLMSGKSGRRKQNLRRAGAVTNASIHRIKEKLCVL